MRRIIVASKNPVKIEAARLGFTKMFKEDFEIIGKDAKSDVSSQPRSDEETLRGARNRAQNAKLINPDADFWIGLEGGVQKIDDEYHSFAWIYICSKLYEGKSKSSLLFLPRAIANLLDEGYELGVVDDKLFGMQNSKQGIGGVGILTKEVLTRTTFYESAVILALVPFINEELFKKT